MKLSIPDMNCGHCKASVLQLLGQIDPNAQIEVDIPGREVRMDTAVSAKDIITALDAIGFDAKEI